jgi:hypothetical protein
LKVQSANFLIHFALTTLNSALKTGVWFTGN